MAFPAQVSVRPAHTNPRGTPPLFMSHQGLSCRLPKIQIASKAFDFSLIQPHWSTLMQSKNSSISTTGNESDQRSLEAFLESLVILSGTREYAAVAAPFSGFANLTEDKNEGGTFRVHGIKIYNAVVHLERDEEPPHAARPVVSTLMLLFETNAVTLSDIQEIFGDWYRDPVDGVRASFADAFFNPHTVSPTADFLLFASTKEGYVETLNPNSPIESMVATWQDDRYNTENRPW